MPFRRCYPLFRRKFFLPLLSWIFQHDLARFIKGLKAILLLSNNSGESWK